MTLSSEEILQVAEGLRLGLNATKGTAAGSSILKAYNLLMAQPFDAEVITEADRDLAQIQEFSDTGEDII